MNNSSYPLERDRAELLDVPEVPDGGRRESAGKKLLWIFLAAIIMVVVHSLAREITDTLRQWLLHRPEFQAAAGLWVAEHEKAALVMPSHGDEYLLAIGGSGYRLRPSDFGENTFTGIVQCVRHEAIVGEFNARLTNVAGRNVIWLHVRIGENAPNADITFASAQ